MFVKVVLLLNEIYNKSVCSYQFGCGSWKEIDNKRTCKWWWYKTLSLCLTNVSYWECTSGNCTWKFIWLFWVYIIYYPHHTDERIWRKVDIITSDFETWGFHRRENVNYDLMGCDAEQGVCFSLKALVFVFISTWVQGQVAVCAAYQLVAWQYDCCVKPLLHSFIIHIISKFW